MLTGGVPGPGAVAGLSAAPAPAAAAAAKVNVGSVARWQHETYVHVCRGARGSPSVGLVLSWRHGTNVQVWWASVVGWAFVVCGRPWFRGRRWLGGRPWFGGRPRFGGRPCLAERWFGAAGAGLNLRSRLPGAGGSLSVGLVLPSRHGTNVHLPDRAGPPGPPRPAPRASARARPPGPPRPAPRASARARPDRPRPPALPARRAWAEIRPGCQSGLAYRLGGQSEEARP